MSRTIRRPQRHLIRWWLPNEICIKRTKDPWRLKLLPGQWIATDHTVIVRILQNEKHRFFTGPSKFHRTQYNKRERQHIRRMIRHGERTHEWDVVWPRHQTYYWD